MKLILPIILLLLYLTNGFCQVNNLNSTKSIKIESRQKSAALNIFNEIEEGISKGNIQSITKHLSQQTYFSFSNGTNGYYSNNQAFYVLADFFKINQVISFRFQNTQADENNSYATGIYIYENKGKRHQSQVYVSLVQSGKVWKINQITIN